MLYFRQPPGLLRESIVKSTTIGNPPLRLPETRATLGPENR